MHNKKFLESTITEKLENNKRTNWRQNKLYFNKKKRKKLKKSLKKLTVHNLLEAAIRQQDDVNWSRQDTIPDSAMTLSK